MLCPPVQTVAYLKPSAKISDTRFSGQRQIKGTPKSLFLPIKPRSNSLTLFFEPYIIALTPSISFVAILLSIKSSKTVLLEQ